MGSVKSLSIIIAANIKGLESGLGKANKSLAKFASGAARMGSLMSFGITAPLTALGKSAFDAFANFEDGMMKVKVVTQATQGEFKMLTDEAKRLGSTTEFTAQQVADLQLVLGRKGFDPSAIQGMEQSILNLALATGEDLSLAAEVVGASIKTFGKNASDTASIANTLASAAANSSIQLGTFATAFGHAGASANAVGVDIEELSAMMGVLMDNGIKASKAGTGLRKIFSKLHKEGVKFSEVLDLATQGELGLEKAMKIAGLTSGGQLLILAKNKKKVAELSEEYRTNTTRLDEMTEAMGSRAKAKVAIMNSAIEGLKIEMGALIYEAVIPLIAKITEWTNAFKELSKSTQRTILKVAGFAALIGPLLLSLALLTTAVGFVSTALKTMWKGLVLASKGIKALTLAMAKNPLGALAIILASVAAYWLITAKNNKKANDVLDSTAIKARTAAERLAEINKELDRSGKSNNDLIKEELLESFEPLKKKAEELKEELDLLNKEYESSFDLKVLNRIGELSSEYSNITTEANTYWHALDKLRIIEEAQAEALNGTGVVVDELAQSYEEIIRLMNSIPPSYAEQWGIDFNADPIDPPEGGSGGRELTDLEKNLQIGADSITGFFDTWGDSINMVGDIFGQMIDNQMVALENKHNKEAALIENSTMTEKQKSDAMVALEKKTAKEKSKILRKAAIAEKAANIISATMNTALAMSKALAQGGFVAGIPMSAIVGGLGALQVAAIAAAPIPAFAQGGLVTGATMGLVGEGRGTTKSNPEVIAPLDKLQAMLGDTGGVSYIPDVRISGDDLLIVFDRANRRKARR